VLVGVQIALTLAIVSNALLLASEHVQRTHRPSGVDETDLMVITSVSNAPPSELRARAEADLAALRGTPGIVDAFATNSYPLAQAGSQIWIDRRPLADHDLQQRPRSAQYFVDEHALATYGLRLVSGRWFRPEEVGDEGDPALVPVVVITRALAQRLFPEGSALGATVYTRGDVPQTVVGIVERMQTPWPNPGANSAIVEQSTLFPYRLADAAMIYVVRARSGGLSAAMASAEQRLRELDPERVIANQRTFAEVRSDVYRSSRALSGILGAVSVLLVIVTALGVVGLTAYWTSQRRQQIGVRRALGARRADILQRFQLETLLVAGGGLGAGSLLAVTLNLLLVGSIETTRMSSGQLVAGVLTVLVIVQLAALWPSLRAASVPPALATRAG
jgi:putative ABC transport system permease protein